MNRSLLEKYKINYLSDIIGQVHNISFLKNSLFKNIFYPVYIFSGIRGTGKTTTARLFSYSMQCHNLKNFQSNHNLLNPCYKCESCLLHKKNQHPDLIELDAASHTGVDTIRAIIDNAYMLPIISTKKIYIIDEAHMLSKAAFNACLKIMEEPPINVHFVLATTELNKIIETVRSRSIILYYQAINYTLLQGYLKKICQTENIEYDEQGIEIITKMANGSIRDALNIMNKIIITHNKITNDILEAESGFVMHCTTESLIESFLECDSKKYYEQKAHITLKQEIQKKQFFEDIIIILQDKIFALEKQLEKSSLYKIHTLLNLFYQYEEQFYQTQVISGILDIIFFKFNQPNNIQTNHTNSSNTSQNTIPVQQTTPIIPENNEKKDDKNTSIENKFDISELSKKEKLLTSFDKVLKTIFQKASIESQDDQKTLIVHFKKNFVFYNTYLLQNQKIIQDAVSNIFSPQWKITYAFDLENSHTNQSNQVITTELQKDNHIQIKENHKTKQNSLSETAEAINEKKKKISPAKNVPNIIVEINNILPGKTYTT